MHPETEQLFTTLGEIVKNLNSGGSGIGSEGNHPFHPLVWDTSGLLMPIQFDELIEIWHKRFLNPGLYSKAQSQNLLSQAMPKYQLLLDILRSQPINLQAYKIQTYNEQPGTLGNDGFRGYDLLGFIFGQTNDGNWVGFSQALPPPDRAAFGKRLSKQDYQPSQAALRLDEQLKPILPDLNSLIVYQFAS
ncbi:MAG TPA: hypothetical protein VIQ31_19215, partial [Phormidium sp.]